MEQLILHLLGDYILQSDWMAQNKTKQSYAALCHAICYSLPFLLIGSWNAWWVIFLTHFFIDRLRLAKYVVYGKNVVLGPAVWGLLSNNNSAEQAWDKLKWCDCKGTGANAMSPPYMAVWLLIIADNTIHLAINFLSLKYL